MNRRRWIQRLAFTGAAGLAVAAFLPGVGASAAEAPTVYKLAGSAASLQYAVNKSPGIQVGTDNLVSAAVPQASSSLLNGGTSEATADAIYPGSIQNAGALICAAASGSCPESFPPDQPVEASAQYPSKQDATTTAPPVTFGGHGAPLRITSNQVEAHAHET